MYEEKKLLVRSSARTRVELREREKGSKPKPLCKESKLRALRIAEQIEKHEEISGLF